MKTENRLNSIQTATKFHSNVVRTVNKNRPNNDQTLAKHRQDTDKIPTEHRLNTIQTPINYCPSTVQTPLCRRCGKEVTPGSVYRSGGDTMVLFFSGELGGYRGFEARLQFEDIPGCCRRVQDGASTHWLSPGYPAHPTRSFVCTLQLDTVGEVR